MWNIATPFGGAVRHTAAYIKPNRIVRDLSGLPPVLGRFGPFEVRLATTRRGIRKGQRLRFKVFFEEGAAIPQQRAALTRRDICPFDKICDHLLVIDKDQRNRFGRLREPAWHRSNCAGPAFEFSSSPCAGRGMARPGAA